MSLIYVFEKIACLV